MAKTPGRINIVNRDSYPAFKPSPKSEYKIKKRIKSVKIIMEDHDAIYKKLKKSGKKIDITSAEIYVNGNQKPDNGIFSSVYGSDTTTDRPFYSCECQNLTGGAHVGEICPTCHKPVVAITDGDLRTTMYIDISPYHILTYHGWKAMSKLFKKDVTPDVIISTVKKINRKGKIVENDIPTLMDLYDDYDDKYEPKTKLPKNLAFTSKIPVYSARLRPLMTRGMTMTILDVNKHYLSIVNNRNVLAMIPLMKGGHITEVQKTLNQIQSDFNEICKFIESQLNTKTGYIRRTLASGRIDYTSRMVISLGIDLMPHEIDIPYQTMMTLYEEEIANCVAKVEGVTIAKAISLVREHAVIRDDRFVKYINQFLKMGRGVWTPINRNPSISESSILYSRIRKVHDDGTDMTMHLPPDVLSLMGADFRF